MSLGSAETVALAGMMGAGKSTVARRLGQLLGRRVVSLDEEIVRAARKPIPAIFAEDGEPAFRALERHAVAALPAGVVADLGGGAFCDPATASRLLATARVVFLDVSAEEAARRIGAGTGRPLAAHWSELRTRRLPLYARAHLRVEVDALTADAVARKILESL
jgi:shikimate kinase